MYAFKLFDQFAGGQIVSLRRYIINAFILEVSDKEVDGR
jgi:hypothetical protein